MINLKKVIVVLTCCLGQFAIAGNLKNNNNPESTNQWNIVSVFSAYKVGKQTVLKLYSDREYELLVFTLKKNKAVENRETGTYRKYGNMIIIQTKSKKKSFNSRFLILEKGKKLHELSDLFTKKSSNVLTVDTCSKYFDKSYIDSEFGEISNDRNLKNKIVDLNFNKTKWGRGREKERILDYKKITFDKTKFIPTDSQFKNMKAILIVGVDLRNNELEFIEEMKTTANFLKELGIDVREFYIAKSIWSDIIKASEGAQILIYAGHGGNPNLADGGRTNFSLSNYTSTKGIVSELKLKKNALVIFNHACHSSGSSAGDMVTLTKAKAVERVEKYAEPFMKIGVAAYYANNYCYTIPRFLVKIFSGQTLSDAYINQAFDKIEIIKPNTYNKRYQTGITSKAVKGATLYYIEDGGKYSAPIHSNITKSYDNAFVGNPNFTVMDFFK